MGSLKRESEITLDVNFVENWSLKMRPFLLGEKCWTYIHLSRSKKIPSINRNKISLMEGSEEIFNKVNLL